MKNFKLFLYLFMIPVIIAIIAYSAGSPGGYSGSPGDGANCTFCHPGTANPVDGWINSNIPPGGYVPGQNYTITAVGTHPGVILFGFELRAEDDAGDPAGTLTVSDPLQTQYTNNQGSITHTVNGITPISDMKVWNMGWTAPSKNIGNIGFYAAFNAADGSGAYRCFCVTGPFPVFCLLGSQPDSVSSANWPLGRRAPNLCVDKVYYLHHGR